MNKNIIIPAIIGVLLGIGIILFMQKASVDMPSNTITASYSDGSSRVEAEFDNDAHTVTFTQRAVGTVTLPQAISGSGARYANEDESIVFWEHQGELTITKDGETVFIGEVD